MIAMPLRRSVNLGHRDASVLRLLIACVKKTDDQLFGKITNNTQHLCTPFYPHNGNYELRQRVHNFPTSHSVILTS